LQSRYQLKGLPDKSLLLQEVEIYGLLPFSIALICYYFGDKCTGTSNDENHVIATMMIVKTRK